MKLLINGIEVDFDNLVLTEELANVSTLTGRVYDNISVSSNVEIPDYFTGIIINTRHTNDGTTFTAVDDAWKLRGKPITLKHYFGWKLNDIMLGKSTSNFEYACGDNPKIGVGWSANLNEKGYVVISGCLNDTKYTEYLPMVATKYYPNQDACYYRAKTKWCKDSTFVTETTDATWTQLNAIHIEDNYGNIIYDLGVEGVDVYDNDVVIAELRTTNCIPAKVKDGRAINGLLYDSNLNYNASVDDNYLNDGRFNVSGSNALEVLKSICDTAVSFGTSLTPFSASFWVDDNTLYLRGAGHKLRETLREGQEILSYRYSTNMEHIANKIDYVTSDNVYSRKDETSINKYGLYELNKNISLDDIDASVQAEYLLDHSSRPEESFVIDIYNKDIKIGDKVNISLMSMNKDKTVQKIVTKFGTNTTMQTVTLSDYIPFNSWVASRHNEKYKYRLYEIFLRGVKRIVKENISSGFHQIVYSTNKNPAKIIASCRAFSKLKTTPGPDGHTHEIDFPADSDIQLP